MTTPAEQTEFLNPEQFLPSDYTTLHTLGALPAGLRQALQEQPMADAGKPFTVGCVGDPRQSLPRARLIFAALDTGNRHCLLHYEQGGIAHLYFVAYYQLRTNKSEREYDSAKLLWRSNVPRALGDLAAFKQLISDGKFDVKLASD